MIVGQEQDYDNREEDKSGDSYITEGFDRIIQDRKNNGRTTKSLSVGSRGRKTDLHSLIIKLLNAEKAILKNDYGFYEAFNIFDKIDKCKKVYEYKPSSSNEISTKNVILKYFRNMKGKLIDMFFLLLVLLEK